MWQFCVGVSYLCCEPFDEKQPFQPLKSGREKEIEEGVNFLVVNTCYVNSTVSNAMVSL